MANAGTVNVNLVANSSNFVDGMEKANKMLAKFGWQSSETVKDIAKIKQSIDGFVTVIKGFTGFAVVSSLIDSFRQMRSEVAQFASGGLEVYKTMNRQAAAIGANIDVLSSFKLMASGAGVESEKFTSALVNMQKAVEKSKEYGSEADIAFKQLGIRFSDLIGLSVDEQYKMIADAIARTNDQTVKVTASSKIFGDASKDLFEILNQGSAAYDRASSAIEKYGTKINDAAKVRLKVLSEQLAKMQEEIDKHQVLAQAYNAENEIQKKAAELADAKSKADKAAKAGRDTYLSDLVNITEAQSAEYRERLFQVRDYQARVADAMKSQGVAATEAAKTQAVASKTVTDAKKEEIVATMRAVAIENRRNDVAKEQKKILDEMYLVRVKQDEQEEKTIRKTQENYRNAIGVVNKFYSDVQEAKNKAAAEYKKEWENKSPADDPLVKRRIAENQMAGSQFSPGVRQQLEAIKMEQLAIEQGLGTPYNSPELRYKRQVELLLKEEDIRAADERKKRMDMEQQARLTAYSGFFGNIATIASEFSDQSKEMFLISKAASIAQAEINAWMAYSNIMANESLKGGFISAQMMAGMALAAGQVAVLNIMKQAPPGRANGGHVTRNTLYEVAEKGPEILESRGKSYLLNGDSSGRVQPLGPGSGGRIVVNVNNLPGQTARVSEGGTPDNPSVTIDIIDSMVASAVSQPRSATSRALQSRFGLNAARGAG